MINNKKIIKLIGIIILIAILVIFVLLKFTFCVKKNQRIEGPLSSLLPCCFGLKKIIPTPETWGCNVIIGCDCHVCLKCGDGICEGEENKCNCPKDCGEIDINNTK